MRKTVYTHRGLNKSNSMYASDLNLQIGNNISGFGQHILLHERDHILFPDEFRLLKRLDLLRWYGRVCTKLEAFVTIRVQASLSASSAKGSQSRPVP